MTTTPARAAVRSDARGGQDRARKWMRRSAGLATCGKSVDQLLGLLERHADLRRTRSGNTAAELPTWPWATTDWMDRTFIRSP